MQNVALLELLPSFSKSFIVFILPTYNDASFFDPHHQVMAIHRVWLEGLPVRTPTPWMCVLEASGTKWVESSITFHI
jgi:hypothetical protein